MASGPPRSRRDPSTTSASRAAWPRAARWPRGATTRTGCARDIYSSTTGARARPSLVGAISLPAAADLSRPAAPLTLGKGRARSPPLQLRLTQPAGGPRGRRSAQTSARTRCATSTSWRRPASASRAVSTVVASRTFSDAFAHASTSLGQRYRRRRAPQAPPRRRGGRVRLPAARAVARRQRRRGDDACGRGCRRERWRPRRGPRRGGRAAVRRCRSSRRTRSRTRPRPARLPLAAAARGERACSGRPTTRRASRASRASASAR